jgi:WhiB family redox-sensing transcriptional regulator
MKYDTIRPPEPSTSWHDQAACVGYPTDWWFADPTLPGGQTKNNRARTLCATCPVRSECLEYAITNREPEGIWGGMNVKERRREARRRRFRVV